MTDELQQLRDRLSIAEAEQRRLQADNAALAARAALAVTQEANVREVERLRDSHVQPCYRCGHSPAAPDPGCPCCHDAHTPNADGDFTGATAEEFADYMRTMRP